jgi:hemerythrin superfamily protein
MHIFEALMKDHEKVKELLSELVSLREDDHESRNDLVDDIRDELIPHSRAEESVFYNSLRALDAGKNVVLHSYAEHLEAETLLRTLQIEEKINLGWKATAQKLKDSLEHHIHEEETKVFAVAREVITKEEAETLGKLFEDIKPQIQDEGFIKTSFDLVANLMPVRISAKVKEMKKELKAS